MSMRFFAVMLLLTGCHTTSVQYRQEIRKESLELRNSVYNVFLAYETENAALLESLLASDFQTQGGASATSYNRVEMGRAVRDDFRNLEGTFFEVYVDAVRAVGDVAQGAQQISMTWSRRARAQMSGEEWLVSRGVSRMTFRKEDGVWKLSLIEGDPMLGLSGIDGAITMGDGTINGAPAAGRRIENGRLAQ